MDMKNAGSAFSTRKSRKGSLPLALSKVKVKQGRKEFKAERKLS